MTETFSKTASERTKLVRVATGMSVLLAICTVLGCSGASNGAGGESTESNEPCPSDVMSDDPVVTMTLLGQATQTYCTLAIQMTFDGEKIPLDCEALDFNCVCTGGHEAGLYLVETSIEDVIDTREVEVPLKDCRPDPVDVEF